MILSSDGACTFNHIRTSFKITTACIFINKSIFTNLWERGFKLYIFLNFFSWIIDHYSHDGVLSFINICTKKFFWAISAKPAYRVGETNSVVRQQIFLESPGTSFRQCSGVSGISQTTVSRILTITLPYHICASKLNRTE